MVARKSVVPEPWGRLLIAGGTDFATLGRKDRSGKNYFSDDRPDLPGAHLMRKVANIKFKKVFTSHSSCHAVIIDVDDRAYLLGRNDNHQLSHQLPAHLTEAHSLLDGTASSTPAALQPFPLLALPDSNVPKRLKEQCIVHAACGRSHTILVTDKGEAWVAGNNAVGQCALDKGDRISSFTRVIGALAKETIVAASAGVTFSLFLTKKGKVFSAGSGEKGQLGTGETGERIHASKTFFLEQSEPVEIEGALKGKKIVQITSGQQHSMALDDQGFVYAWGFAGLGRLGLGHQVDQLVPVVVPQFAGPNVLTRCKKLTAGSTNTLFIDMQGHVWLCGKFKLTGDGSVGQPWMQPKMVHDIMGYKWSIIAAGGVTLFAAGNDKKEGDMLIAWGQNAQYGELALGEGQTRSATKPQRIEAFDGVTLLDVAAAQNTTFFIARPPPTGSTRNSPVPTDSQKEAAIEEAAAASTSAPDAAASQPAVKPAIDLSGWGFSFMPPPAAADSAGTPTAKSSANAAVPTPVETANAKTENENESRTKPDAWAEFPRYPPALDAVEQCLICQTETEEEPLECDMCENAYHMSCLRPPLTSIPEGEWFCPTCSGDELPTTTNERTELVDGVSKRGTGGRGRGRGRGSAATTAKAGSTRTTKRKAVENDMEAEEIAAPARAPAKKRTQGRR